MTQIGRFVAAVSLGLAAFTGAADVQVINGVRYVCEDGVCRMEAPPVESAMTQVVTTVAQVAKPVRILQGQRSPDAFLAFLRGETATDDAAQESSRPLVLTLLLILLGGLAMNLTPCVLPMIPVNLIVIGRSWQRGLAYGLGQVLAYGALGLAAAIGGLAFGSIQASPWFNAAVALVFAMLALSLLGAFTLDFSRFRTRFAHPAAVASPTGGRVRLVVPFGLGALSAVLAGACVAPILVSVLLLTADLYARGEMLALALPFVLGLGLALPWPFLGAGLKVLPRPGAWMRWVNWVFAAVLIAFACWYGRLAVIGWRGAASEADGAHGAEATPATFEKTLAKLQASGKPILVDCWATWCKNCAAMERGTLREPRVRAALEAFEVLRLQAEDIRELKRLPGFESVQGLPAFAIVE